MLFETKSLHGVIKYVWTCVGQVIDVDAQVSSITILFCFVILFARHFVISSIIALVMLLPGGG